MQTDILDLARQHLRRIGPHVTENETARILAEMVKELQWQRGRPPEKITMHWLRAAFDRVAAGEPEDEVMLDFGYERHNAKSQATHAALSREVACTDGLCLDDGETL